MTPLFDAEFLLKTFEEISIVLFTFACSEKTTPPSSALLAVKVLFVRRIECS